MHVISMIDIMDKDTMVVPIKERFGAEELLVVRIILDSDGVKGFDEIVTMLFDRGSYFYVPKKLDLDLKNRTTSPARPSTKESLVLELNSLSSNLCYVFLAANNTIPVIIIEDLLELQDEALISVLQRFTRAISWTIVTLLEFHLEFSLTKFILNQNVYLELSANVD